MIEEKFETKTYTKTEQVMVSQKRYCDVCTKEITGPHWQITTGHHDWGYDSVDSIKQPDVCSPECLRELFDKYIQKSNEDGGRYNTQYFEIEHYRWPDVKGEIKYD